LDQLGHLANWMKGASSFDNMNHSNFQPVECGSKCMRFSFIAVEPCTSGHQLYSLSSIDFSGALICYNASHDTQLAITPKIVGQLEGYLIGIIMLTLPRQELPGVIASFRLRPILCRVGLSVEIFIERDVLTFVY